MRSIFSTMSMLSECRELSLLAVWCCYTTRRCLIMQDSLSEFMSNAPSDSDGDLPQAIWHFERFSESWLNCPRWWKLIMSAPWLAVFFHLRWSLRRSLFDHAGFVAGIQVQCPTWLRRRFAPSWLAFWEILWILTGLPQMMDHDHAGLLVGSVSCWEDFCSLDIHRTNFSAVWTNSRMQTMLF